jgi:general stress protein YciG
VADKDARTYIRVHDGMPDHPKIDNLSDAAFRLLVTMWCWCSRHLTDGRVPAGTWQRRGTTKARAELVAAHLADVAADGSVLMHDYTDHQRTADEVRALREKRAEAGRKGGKATARAQANASANGKQISTIDIDIDTVEENTSDDVPAIEQREDVERICRHLVDRMVGNGYSKPAITTRWRESARLLIEKDGRTEEQIHRAIDFAHDSDFWRSNIRSVPKLRSQYDTLRLQAQRNGSPQLSRAEVASARGIPEAWV